MKEISQIPTDELLKDKAESIVDIQNCTMALRTGIVEYSGGSVQERLDINQRIVNRIDQELKTRKYEIKCSTP